MIFEVTPKPRYIEVIASGREGIVSFPTYLPGSYIIRELERNVVEFEGIRVSKNKFYVKDKFRYLVYASSKDQREAISTSDYLFINPPAVFPYQDKYENYCVKLNVKWPLKTTMEKRGEYYCADDYESFVDSPIQASPILKTIMIDENHEISTIDDVNPGSVKAVLEDIDREMGTSEKYVFFFRRSDRNFGGIEHLNSSAIVVNWDRTDLTLLMAHEYFHRWNVRKFRPLDLDLDLERESYTDLLWFAEGVTDYVAWLSSTRVGAIKPEDAGKYLATAMSKLTFPGARRTSLAESSRTTWIKYYRQDENFLNSSVSYYDGGLLIGLILDMLLRDKGENIFSIFRNIPSRYTFHDIDSYLKSRNIEVLEELIYYPSARILEKLSGMMEIDLVDKDSPYFGIMLDGNKITYVEDGSPADSAGLIPQDVLIATDEIVKNIEVKSHLNVLINREGRVKKFTLMAGKSPGHKVKIAIRGDIARRLLNVDSIDGTSTTNII